MAATKKMTAEEAMSQIAFVQWEHAAQAIMDYTRKKMGEVNEEIDAKKDLVQKCISDVAKFEIGTSLSLGDFETYVNLHRKLRDAMKDIRHCSAKLSCETQGMINDSMKLIDLKRARYYKFLEKKRVPEYVEYTPLSITMGSLAAVTIMVIVFCFYLGFDVYSLGDHFSILNYAKL